MHPKTFFESVHPEFQSGTCFVLMPFSDDLTEVYETIREAVGSTALNFACQRADDIRGAGYIMESVLEGIGKSEFVIADLTTANPNVFYEVGIAHMAKEVNKVILLVQESETIPFDLSPFRCIKYKQSIAGAKKLKTDLISCIKEEADMLITINPNSPPIYQFRLEERKAYRFSKRLFGEGNCLYDFEVFADYIGLDGAKFTIEPTQYIAGRPPQKLDRKGFGMGVGTEEKLPKLPWKLRLENTAGQTAIFQVLPE